jgi:hypothetical protein
MADSVVEALILDLLEWLEIDQQLEELLRRRGFLEMTLLTDSEL